MLTRLTGDRAHSEEIASDVFHKLSQRPALLDSREDLTAWIYRVATNAGFDALRTNSRRRKREEAAGIGRIHAAAAPSALDAMLAEERRVRVRAVLECSNRATPSCCCCAPAAWHIANWPARWASKPASVGTMLARAEAEFRAQVSRALRRTRMTQCWSEGALRAYLDRELPTEDMQRVAAHLGECTACDGLCTELAARAAHVSALMELLPEWSAAMPVRARPRWSDNGGRIGSASPRQLAAGLAVAAYLLPDRAPKVTAIVLPPPVYVLAAPPPGATAAVKRSGSGWSARPASRAPGDASRLRSRPISWPWMTNRSNRESSCGWM